MRWSVIIVHGLLSTSVFASELDPERLKRIRVGIEQNKLEYVTDSLKGVENPFRCVKSGLGKLFDNTPSHYCARENVAQDLLNLAFKAKPCRDEIAVTLLKAGGRFDFGAKHSTEKLLKDAYENICSRTVEHIIAAGPEDEVASAAAKYFAFASSKLTSYIDALKSGVMVDQDGIEALKPISESFRKYVLERCPDVSKATPACSARESFETAKAKTEQAIRDAERFAQEEDAKEEFANSPEGIRAAICEIDRQLVNAKSRIERQKKIGEISGAVNLLELNNAGTEIVDLRQSRKDLERRYMQVTKKKFSTTSCR